MHRTPEQVEDEMLVLLCQDGDPRALHMLITRWQPRLMRLAWRLTDDREAARDAVQETWLAIVRGIRRLHDPARFPAWAYRILNRRCTDWLRRRIARRRFSRELQTMQADESTVVASTAGPGGTDTPATEPAGDLRAALARLPAGQRAILALHSLDDLPLAQIADILGIPQGTVKSRLYHARHALRLILKRTTHE